MGEEIDPEDLLNTITAEEIKTLLTDIYDELVLQKAILNDIKTNTGL